MHKYTACDSSQMTFKTSAFFDAYMSPINMSRKGRNLIALPGKVCVCACFSCVQLFATLWTVARQAPLSLGFSRQDLKWVAMPSSRGSSRPRDLTHISYISCTGRGVVFFFLPLEVRLRLRESEWFAQGLKTNPLYKSRAIYTPPKARRKGINSWLLKQG